VSVSVLGELAPIVGWRSAGHRLDAVASDIGMNEPHLGHLKP